MEGHQNVDTLCNRLRSSVGHHERDIMSNCRWTPRNIFTGTGHVFQCDVHDHTKVIGIQTKVICTDRPERVDMRPYYVR